MEILLRALTVSHPTQLASPPFSPCNCVILNGSIWNMVTWLRIYKPHLQLTQDIHYDLLLSSGTTFSFSWSWQSCFVCLCDFLGSCHYIRLCHFHMYPWDSVHVIGNSSGPCCPFSPCLLSPRGENVTAERSAFPCDFCGDVWCHSDPRFFVLLLFFFLDAWRIVFSVLTFHSDMSCCWPLFLQHRHSGNSCLLVLGNFLKLISLIIAFTLRSVFCFWNCFFKCWSLSFLSDFSYFCLFSIFCLFDLLYGRFT